LSNFPELWKHEKQLNSCLNNATVFTSETCTSMSTLTEAKTDRERERERWREKVGERKRDDSGKARIYFYFITVIVGGLLPLSTFLQGGQLQVVSFLGFWPC